MIQYSMSTDCIHWIVVHTKGAHSLFQKVLPTATPTYEQHASWKSAKISEDMHARVTLLKSCVQISITKEDSASELFITIKPHDASPATNGRYTVEVKGRPGMEEAANGTYVDSHFTHFIGMYIEKVFY